MSLMKRMGEDFFIQPGIEYIREGWAAATFGIARNVRAVQLVTETERWPDFRICVNERPESWEFTEATFPGRRRGQEYRDDPLLAGDRALGLDYQENYIANAKRAPETIRALCVTKAKKNYAGRAALLIYLNISYFGTDHQEIVNSFAEATDPAKDAFTEVSILWKARVYSIWENGYPARRV